MQHERTYPHFQSYIEKHAKDYNVYLNMYLMIKIYQNEINKLGSIDQMLTFNDAASQSQRTAKSKRSNRKIKLEMDKIPKFKKNKEQLEGE